MGGKAEHGRASRVVGRLEDKSFWRSPVVADAGGASDMFRSVVSHRTLH